MSKSFFEREYTCPVCKITFKSLSIRSSATYVETKEADLHIIYKGVSPLHYSIIVCPTCEYAASNTSFIQNLERVKAEQLAVALAQLKSDEHFDFVGERDLETTLKTFQLAIRTAQLKMVSSAELSGLILAAGWIAREMGNINLEKVYINEALKHYLDAYHNDSGAIGNLDDITVTYLIGELHRRSGNYSDAINWFNKVIYHKAIKQNPNIEKLAREQWALAREEAKNINHIDDGSQVSTPNNSPVKITTEIDEKDNRENDKQSPSSSARRRSTMQMSANLYADQIDWLKKISNNGHKNINKLFPREAVLRSLVDLVIDQLGEEFPTQFTSEEELIEEFRALLFT